MTHAQIIKLVFSRTQFRTRLLQRYHKGNCLYFVRLGEMVGDLTDEADIVFRDSRRLQYKDANCDCRPQCVPDDLTVLTAATLDRAPLGGLQFFNGEPR